MINSVFPGILQPSFLQLDDEVSVFPSPFFVSDGTDLSPPRLLLQEEESEVDYSGRDIGQHVDENEDADLQLVRSYTCPIL